MDPTIPEPNTTPPAEPGVTAGSAGRPREGGRALRSRLGREVRLRIDQALSRVQSPPESRAACVERRLKAGLAPAWEHLKRRPALGVVAAGGLGILAAEVVGVSELLLAVAFGYAAYDVLKKRIPLAEAVEEAEELIQP